MEYFGEDGWLGNMFGMFYVVVFEFKLCVNYMIRLYFFVFVNISIQCDYCVFYGVLECFD